MPKTNKKKGSTQKKNEKTKIITKALEVALYYGFVPQPAPTITKDDVEKARKILASEPRWKAAGEDGSCLLCESAEEEIAILRTYEERGMGSWPQPVMVAFEGPLKGSRGEKPNPKEFHFRLEILGATKSIAEAILAKAAYDILREEGFTDLYIDVNSVGDKDSIARYVREITAYYKKHNAVMSAKCRDLIKKNVFEITCTELACKEIHDRAPQPINFLSEASRQHFREVLEYLESTNLPYRINPAICGERAIATHTAFEIKSLPAESSEPQKEAPTLAFGMRYNNLARRIGMKKDIPAIGISIVFKKSATHGKRTPVLIRKAKIYFIQLGFEAKLKSLSVIETLRKADIPIIQSLPKDKLAAQLSAAEELGIPYTLIFGQKEALDGTVIIRNMANRSQDTVKIEELASYIKKIR